ncbi:MAG: T9SS type A sorting domain-containing protein, partial [Bacteroidetes bacterium]|nr:T9SS type A sorting domain-containing protein [Bacteroidota bacterium]
TGSATAYAFGGVAPYSFQWSAGQSGQTATGLSAGTYQLTVSDANGCTLVQQVDIPFENDFIIDVATQDVVCHGESTGSILVSGWGGTPLYTYEWSNGTVETETSPNAGSEIFNLNAGTYYVTVSDAAGCTIVESVEITEPPELLVNVNTTQTGCQGENTGTATADISGGTPPYTYTWSNGSTTPSVTDLEAGEYWLMIMDANYCTLVKSFEITESEGLTIEINSTNVLCGETNTGVATANVIGGTPPYTYAWNTGASTQTISDLPPGTYTVVVSDANGCGDFEMVTITEVGDVAIQINADQISCFGTNDGVVSALVSGGTPPYDYLWNTGAVSSTLTNLESGAYSVTVTDVNNCSSSAMATLLQPASVNISLSGTSVSCYGYSDGSASVSVSGGTPPYNYLWSSGQTTPLITGLTAGVYEIIITDNSGCISSANFTILQPQELIITTDVTNAACGNAGAISAIVTGGTPPYQYEWSNGQTASTADNLSADTYSLTVSDANGCVVAASATVLSSDDLSCVVNVVSEISTSNGSDGTVSADALGGTTPYSYLWSNGQSAQTISDLPEGTYTVTITDTEGCTTSCSVTLTAPEDCENLTDPGEIGVDQYLCGPGGDPDPIVNIEFPSGGSGNIQYMWMTYNEPVPFSPNIWQAIPDETGPSYDPGPVFETTYFIRCARREGCPNFIETEAVTVEVGEEVVATIIEPDLICEDELVQFSAVDVGEGAIYNWDFGLAGNPQTATGSSVEVAFSSFGPFDITLWVTQDGCTSMDINRIYVTDNPADCGNVTFLLDVDVLSPHEVELEWSLPTSQNNYQFIVERSPDGEEFQPIAAINDWTEYENGELYLYRYVDEKPKRGKSFYRIKTVVESGARIFYSNVEEAMIYPGSNLLFIYPNPVDNELFIEVVDSYNTSIEVDITDVQGRVLETISLPNGTLRKAIDFTDYSRGIYFLRAFYDGKDMKVIKAVKM